MCSLFQKQLLIAQDYSKIFVKINLVYAFILLAKMNHYLCIGIIYTKIPAHHNQFNASILCGKLGFSCDLIKSHLHKLTPFAIKTDIERCTCNGKNKLFLLLSCTLLQQNKNKKLHVRLKIIIFTV